MSKFNILLTHPEADEFESFTHSGSDFEFAHINPEGPKLALEGSVWIFIDWVLDEMAGLELCRRMRADAQTSNAHITMVLDDNNLADRKRALDAGADDYIVGPVDRRSVLDRVLALNPAFPAQYATDVLTFGPLRIDLRSYRAFWDDNPIDLTAEQIRLLHFLAENANRTSSREELILGLGKSEQKIDYRTVDVWIRRLRQAIGNAGGGSPLRTIRSKGYVFDL